MESRKGKAMLSRRSGPLAGSSLKRTNTGFSGRRGITLLACVHLQGGQNKATEDKGHLEVLAKDLFILHQVFRLRVAVDIVKNFS